MTPPVPEYAPAAIHCGPSATRSSGACCPQTTFAAGVHGGGGGWGGGCATSGADAAATSTAKNVADDFIGDPPPGDGASHRSVNGSMGQLRSGVGPTVSRHVVT